MVEIPENLRDVVAAREGAAGVAWLGSLPGLVDELLQRWSCVPDGAQIGGKVGIVVPAKSAAHGNVVLKVSFPHPANVHEPDAYATWAGHGAAALFERDDAVFAMLLERIGPDMLADLDDIDEATAIAGSLSRQLAVPTPSHLPRLSDLADEWLATVRRASGRLPAIVVEQAIDSIEELCRVQPETMVHGDLHYTNVLRGVREPWQVIDPKGLVGDPGFDVITPLRPAAVRLLDQPDLPARLLRLVEVFADAAGLDREHARRWAQLRAVDYAQRSWDRNDDEWLRVASDRLAEILTRAQ